MEATRVLSEGSKAIQIIITLKMTSASKIIGIATDENVLGSSEMLRLRVGWAFKMGSLWVLSSYVMLTVGYALPKHFGRQELLICLMHSYPTLPNKAT